MATILIVGAAAQLEEGLAERGHAVRSLPEPENLGAILPQLQGVSALVWLGRQDLLESLATKLVDTHVRGFACLPDGEAIASRFSATYGMPTAIIRDDGDDGDDGDAVSAVESLLRA